VTGVHLRGRGFEVGFEASRAGSGVSFDLRAWSAGRCWGDRVAGVGAVVASLAGGGAVEWSPTRVKGAGWPVGVGDVAVRLLWGVAQGLAMEGLGSSGAVFEGSREPVFIPAVGCSAPGVSGV